MPHVDGSNLLDGPIGHRRSDQDRASNDLVTGVAGSLHERAHFPLRGSMRRVDTVLHEAPRSAAGKSSAAWYGCFAQVSSTSSMRRRSMTTKSPFDEPITTSAAHPECA